MPRLGSNQSQNLQQQVAGPFKFSATRIEDLGASEYTLCTIIADRSGSVSSFQLAMEAALKEILSACLKSQRADNLLVRLLTFDGHVQEVHGFKLLSEIKPDDYDGVLSAGGTTALFDAAADGITATNAYGRTLLQQDFSVNGIVFVITDGEDVSSSSTVNQVKQALEAAVSGENLESLVSVLIGVNIQSPHIKQLLDNFYQQAGFTQFEVLEKADKNSLAKLAQFVSKSISSQSQALGSGGPSQSITF